MNHIPFRPLCLLSFYTSLLFHLFLFSQTTSTHNTKTPPRGSRTLLFIFPFIHLHPSIPHRHLRGSCYFTKPRPNRKVAHVYITAFILVEEGIAVTWGNHTKYCT